MKPNFCLGQGQLAGDSCKHGQVQTAGPLRGNWPSPGHCPLTRLDWPSPHHPLLCMATYPKLPAVCFLGAYAVQFAYFL